MKTKTSNRVFIGGEPKAVQYALTEEDKQYGLHFTPERTVYENDKVLGEIGYNITNARINTGMSILELADAVGVKESTIIGLTRDTSKAQMSVLLKVINYLNLELKNIL